LQKFITLDAMIEKTSLQQQYEQMTTELPTRQRELAEAEGEAAAAEGYYFIQCPPELNPSPLQSRSKGPTSQIQINPCSGYLRRMNRPDELRETISDLQAKLTAVAKRLPELNTLPDSSNLKSGVPQAAPDLRQLKRDFLWVPTFLLIGIVFQLGKTTCSLCPI
jgi:hypothetical protein